MLKGFIVLVVLVSLSFAAHSNDSYQFYGGGVFSFEDYDDGSNGRYKSFSAGAYLDSIWLDSDLPIDEAAFWQRSSSIALNYGQFERDDMLEVRGGRILIKKESSNGMLSLRLVHSDVPVWFGWRELYTGDTKYTFLGEGDNNSFEVESEFNREFSLGFYLTNKANLALSYYEDGEYQAYSLFFNQLFSLVDRQFLALDLEFEYFHDQGIELEVQNGLLYSKLVEYYWGAISGALTYYPNSRFSVWVLFRQENVDYAESYLRHHSLGTAYNFHSGIRVSMSVERVALEHFVIWPEQDSTHYNLSFAYRF